MTESPGAIALDVRRRSAGRGHTGDSIHVPTARSSATALRIHDAVSVGVAGYQESARRPDVARADDHPDSGHRPNRRGRRPRGRQARHRLGQGLTLGVDFSQAVCAPESLP